MSNLRDWFEKIKKSNNPDEINDFLIKIGNNPHSDNLSFLSYFIKDFDPDIHLKIKINLVYALGELGRIEKLDVNFINYLIDEYYKSDRWIRNEIIIALGKISTKLILNKDVIMLIGNSLNEDYFQIKMNALKALLHKKNIPNQVLRNILIILNLSDTELERHSLDIIKNTIIEAKNLFNFLNHTENYKLLKKKALRVLLSEFFRSPIHLETFKEDITNSNWEKEQKSMILSETDVFEKILLNNI